MLTLYPPSPIRKKGRRGRGLGKSYLWNITMKPRSFPCFNVPFPISRPEVMVYLLVFTASIRKYLATSTQGYERRGSKEEVKEESYHFAHWDADCFTSFSKSFPEASCNGMVSTLVMFIPHANTLQLVGKGEGEREGRVLSFGT